MRHLTFTLASAVLLLAGCSQQAPSDPDAKPGLSVGGARLVLPAVKGNPGAAYFELQNSGEKPAELAAVYVTGAGGAEIHETAGGNMDRLDKVTVLAGSSVSFAPGGKHVMVFDLTDAVAAGGTTEMTLSFADGDKLSAPLKVEPAGAGAAHGDSAHGSDN